MVKYYLTYTGIEGDVYLLDILEKDFAGEPTEIHGYANHNYTDRKDLVQFSVPSTLDISLEADEDLTLQDLYTEEESKYKIRFKRNDQVIFYGILKPDGIWEDFVSERWKISMDAMDGLSILKDLSFVKDDGTFYTGKITQFDTLKQCLHRIGYDLPINISTGLPVFEGFDSTDTVLKSVLINADRFYQDEKKDNIMDCEEVLKSVLEIYSATVIQMHGEWWVFRAIDVKDEMTFYRYDGEEKTDIIWTAALEIGSHFDRYEIYHCNANQKKSIKPSVQAFRVNYKYGTVKGLYVNPQLELGNGLYAEGWYIDDLGGRVVPYGAKGVKVIDDVRDGDKQFIYNTDLITVTEFDVIDVKFTFYNNYSGFVDTELCYSFQTNNFILSDTGWVPLVGNEGSKIVKNYGRKPSRIEETFTLPPIPEDGNLNVMLWIRKIDIQISLYEFYVLGIELMPNQNANFKGEYHTAQRLTRVSSVTKADKTVNNGDSISNIYYGTLYKDNGTPTEFWHRIGVEESKPLLQIMVEDALRIAPRPMFFFEGDLFGYYPYLSGIIINNVAGKYQTGKYSFDTRRNVNRANFREFDNVDLIEDVDYRYEFTYDYGNETKVTIRS